MCTIDAIKYGNFVVNLGVWIINGKDVFYNQFAQVTFLCPMRFERYPLDEHICKFRVGSTNMDINYMRFGETEVSYDESARNTILDYKECLVTHMVIDHTIIHVLHFTGGRH